jgi:hypothetical protein
MTAVGEQTPKTPQPERDRPSAPKRPMQGRAAIARHRAGATTQTKEAMEC